MEEIDRLVTLAMVGGKRERNLLIDVSARLEGIKHMELGIESI